MKKSAEMSLIRLPDKVKTRMVIEFFQYSQKYQFSQLYRFQGEYFFWSDFENYPVSPHSVRPNYTKGNQYNYCAPKYCDKAPLPAWNLLHVCAWAMRKGGRDAHIEATPIGAPEFYRRTRERTCAIYRRDWHRYAREDDRVIAK